MTSGTEFLIGFAEGTVLMLAVFVVSDWLEMRKANRTAKKEKENL